VLRSEGLCSELLRSGPLLCSGHLRNLPAEDLLRASSLQARSDLPPVLRPGLLCAHVLCAGDLCADVLCADLLPGALLPREVLP
jgi:hypothetical protein